MEAFSFNVSGQFYGRRVTPIFKSKARHFLTFSYTLLSDSFFPFYISITCFCFLLKLQAFREQKHITSSLFLSLSLFHSFLILKMKLSSSSSSTSSLDVNNIYTSSKSATTGCLTGLFRRILCSRSLPTYPSSDHITNSPSSSQEFDESRETKILPSIVAKLMGLDSMPPQIITRSRSMNSLDYNKMEENDEQLVQSQHRRVKSSSTLSFQEMPIFLEVENENEKFLVLSFENGSDYKEKRSRVRKCEKGFAESKRAKVSNDDEENNKRILQEISNCVQDHDSSIKTNSSNNGGKLRKKKKKKAKIVEHESSSEESSPVSVLDFDREVPKTELDSRRKLSTEPENYEHKSRRNDNTLMILDDLKSVCVRVRSRKKLCPDYSEIWDQISEMTDAYIVESNWLYTKKKKVLKHEDFVEDLCADFGFQILDQLLNELVVDSM